MNKAIGSSLIRHFTVHSPTNASAKLKIIEKEVVGPIFRF